MAQTKLTDTYVFDGMEVRLTGRTASRKLASGKSHILYEVTPVDPMTGSFMKWVAMGDMFAITTDTDNE